MNDEMITSVPNSRIQICFNTAKAEAYYAYHQILKPTGVEVQITDKSQKVFKEIGLKSLFNSKLNSNQLNYYKISVTAKGMLDGK